MPICCINCGSERLTELPYVGILKDSSIERELFADLKILVCAECGLGFPNSKLNSKILNSYYQNDYGPLRQFVGDWNSIVISKVFLKLLTNLSAVITLIIGRLDPRNLEKESSRFSSQFNFIKPHLNFDEKLRLLEYGAGDARFSKQMINEHSSEVEVDIIEPAPQYDQSFVNLGFSKIGVDSECLKDEQYKLIHVSHVLQHLPSLENDFKNLSRALVKGGLIFFEVPNACGQYWDARHFPNPPFLNFFSKKAIGGLAKKYGLELVEATTFGESLNFGYCSSYKLGGVFRSEFTEKMFLKFKLKEVFFRVVKSLTLRSIIRGDSLPIYEQEGRAFIRVIYRKI